MKILILGYSNIFKRRILNFLLKNDIKFCIASKSSAQKEKKAFAWYRSYSYALNHSNADFFYQQNPNHNIKNHISQNQGQRCAQCNNYLMQGDSLLKYKIPLQNGGQNNISNLMIVCPTCFNF